MNRTVQLFDLSQKVNYKSEILSGLTVALALIPEAVAFALIAGLSPLTGLFAAFSIGLITSVFGGRPGMISGATGAVAVVIVTLAKDHGVESLSPPLSSPGRTPKESAQENMLMIKALSITKFSVHSFSDQ